MFRHIVLLTLKPDTSDDARASVLTALASLPGQIDSLRSYNIGADAGLGPGNADVCAVGDFDDEAGYLAYRDHPAHKAVVEQHILPVLASRSAIQYSTD